MPEANGNGKLQELQELAKKNPLATGSSGAAVMIVAMREFPEVIHWLAFFVAGASFLSWILPRPDEIPRPGYLIFFNMVRRIAMNSPWITKDHKTGVVKPSPK